MTSLTLAATRARVLAAIPVESVLDDREAHADRIARIAFAARQQPCRRRGGDLELLADAIAHRLGEIVRAAV